MATDYDLAGAELAYSRIESRLQTIADGLSAAAGYDDVIEFLADLGRLEIKTWTTPIKKRVKDADGDIVDETELVTNIGMHLTPKWETGPDWPLVSGIEPVKIKVKKNTKAKHEGTTAVFLPDPQVGFWEVDGVYYPMVDFRAVDVALQIVRKVNPDIVVWLGDFMDFAEYSKKYTQHPSFAFTTNHAIIYANLILALTRDVAPEAAIFFLEGNHDDRLDQWAVENAKQAFGVKRPGDNWPVMSVPFLLNFDTYGIQYVPGHPGASLWLREYGEGGPAIAAEHGKKTKLSARAKSLGYHVFLGHIHHQGVEANTVVDGRGRRRDVYAISPGCLCRVDGFVPSVNQGVDQKGLPVEFNEGWQQGVCVASWMDEGGPMTWTNIPIENGLALYEGDVYRSGRWFTDEDMAVPRDRFIKLEADAAKRADEAYARRKFDRPRR